jgi:CubicO group peptidase (beta-lactamase class C family)
MLGAVAPPRDYWPTQGWRAAPPEAHGVHADLPGHLRAFGEDADSKLNGIVVVRHGYLVCEEYFGPFHAGSLHTVASVTKSVVSLLTGIALGNGLLRLDQPVEDWFPEIVDLDVDPRIREIQLRHLLSMTGGWAQDAYDLDWFTTRPSPVTDALQRPIAHEPGATFWYDNLGAHLVAVLLSRAASTSTAEFARRELLGPLGIWTDQTPRYLWRTADGGQEGGRHTWHARAVWDDETGYPWKRDRAGHTTGYGGLHLSVRDMAKLGLLCLSGGEWEGQALIPNAYLAEALQPHSRGGPPGNAAYGYFWWVREQAPHPYAFAFGSGGQYLFVVPDMDLVVAVASSGIGQGGRHGEVETRELVDRVVIPAVAP